MRSFLYLNQVTNFIIHDLLAIRMKILLLLLVISSLSGLILALVINDRHQQNVDLNEIIITALANQGNKLNNIQDSISNDSLVTFDAKTNASVKLGDTITYYINAVANTDEKLNGHLKLTAESTSHVPIKTFEVQLYFNRRGSGAALNWIIPSDEYLDKLSSDNQVVIKAIAQVNDQHWSKKDLVQVVN